MLKSSKAIVAIPTDLTFAEYIMNIAKRARDDMFNCFGAVLLETYDAT